MGKNESTELSDAEVERLLAAFLKNSLPVEWVDWMYRCKELEAKEALRSALFTGDQLNRLTDPNVRTQVFRVITETPALRDLVLQQISQEIEDLNRRKRQ